MSSRSSNELSEVLETLVSAEECNGFLKDIDYSGNLAFQERLIFSLWSHRFLVSFKKVMVGSLKIPCAAGATEADASVDRESTCGRG